MMDGCVPTFRQCVETATVFEPIGPRTTMEPISLLPRNWSHACDWRQRNSWPCSQLDGRGNRQRYSCGVTVQVDVIFEFWGFEAGVSARSGLNWTEFLEESEMILKELWFDVTGSSDAPFLDSDRIRTLTPSSTGKSAANQSSQTGEFNLAVPASDRTPIIE